MWTKIVILVATSCILCAAENLKCTSESSMFCVIKNQIVSAADPFIITRNSSVKTEGIIITDGEMPIIPNSLLTSYPGVNFLSIVNVSLSQITPDSFNSGGNLQNLLIMQGNLVTLVNGTFKNCKYLQSLQITRHDISFVDLMAFQGLGNLQNLNLNGNQLTSLHPLTFAPLRNLMMINIGSNQLTTLDTNLFAMNLALVSFDLSKNQLTVIPVDLFAAQYLSKGSLDFSENKLTSAQSFGADYVDFSFNNLRSFQFVSGGKTIHIENNFIRKVTCLNANLTLQRLYAVNNSLQNLLCIRDMVNLTDLHVANNKLVKPTQKAFLKLENLRSLQLFNMTRFSSIPAKAFVPLKKLSNLRVDRLDSYKIVKQLLPNLNILGLSTITWNCTYTKLIFDILKPQNIIMNYNVLTDRNRCNIT